MVAKTQTVQMFALEARTERFGDTAVMLSLCSPQPMPLKSFGDKN